MGYASSKECLSSSAKTQVKSVEMTSQLAESHLIFHKCVKALLVHHIGDGCKTCHLIRAQLPNNPCGKQEAIHWQCTGIVFQLVLIQASHQPHMLQGQKDAAIALLFVTLALQLTKHLSRIMKWSIHMYIHVPATS